MSSATCCMTTFVSFSSRHTRVKHIQFLSLTNQKKLRTINDRRDLVDDGLYIVINASHPVVDAGHLIVDSMCGLQNLCSYHLNFFVRQLVQPFQPIFYVSLSNQLLQVFF